MRNIIVSGCDWQWRHTSKVVRNSVYCIVDAYMGVFAGLKFVRSIK